ncbi:MAG: NAD(P)-binding domain-containing protein [Byssovorax sp.]
MSAPATSDKSDKGHASAPAGAGMKVGILGGGAWGVALALGAGRSGAEVTLHSRKDRREVHGKAKITDSYAEIAKSRLIVVAAPSTVVRQVLRDLGDHLDGAHLLVHGIRGLGRERLETISDIIRDETPVRRIGALGGPVQAKELAHGRPSAMVCGSHYPEVIAAVTKGFQHGMLRVYGTPDLRGLEWASALVGCLAVGVGFADQAGAGPGLLAALISRGVDEAAKLAAAAGAEEKTMFGLGGYGDLLASIALDHRPEVVLGKALGRGLSMDHAVAEAKLRVEAIDLIPRLSAFAREAKVPAVTFDALVDILAGHDRMNILERIFRA